MAMQTNLSKKDKMTIAIVLFAGIAFAIGWLLIRPTIMDIIEINDKIEQAQLKKEDYQKKILNLSSGEVLYQKTVADLEESTADYYEIMDSAKIDRMVTSYVLRSGLFAENLVIEMPDGPVNEDAYVYSSLAGDKKKSTSSSSSSSSDTSTKNTGNDSLIIPYDKARSQVKTTQSAGVERACLTLVVTGSRKDCQSFIDDISSKPAVLVTGFEWDNNVKLEEKVNEKTGAVEYVQPGTVRVRINFNLYMADVADYSAVITDSAT